MSDREFENYLTLLSGLLKLRGQQRQAIADELRSHLDDRLEELLAQGVSHDEAIKRALAEFGDAAGLAGQFVTISQQRKQRWLVRLTTFSLAATLLIAASLITFWPGRNAAPGRAIAVAQRGQDPFAPPPAQADPFGQPAPAGVDPFAPAPLQPAEPTLQEKLNKRIDFDVVEMPLKDVMQHLEEQTDIQFVLRLKKLEEASVSHDTPITKSLKRVRVSTLLELMLSDLELTFVEKDDLLLITTPEDAEAKMEIRVYDCRDLLAMPAPPGADQFLPRALGRGAGGMFAVEDRLAQRTSGGMGGFGGAASPAPASSDEKPDAGPISEHDRRATRLMQIIMTNVNMDTWNEVGGPGTISEYNGLIVVTQTDEVHKKVEHVFDMLRQAAGLDVHKGQKSSAEVDRRTKVYE